MSKHTPGPWVLNGVMALDAPLWIVSIPGEQARIEIYDYSQESEANAHLIAAAPELLAALEAAREELRLLREKDGAGPYDPTLRGRIDDAIAKARGES